MQTPGIPLCTSSAAFLSKHVKGQSGTEGENFRRHITFDVRNKARHLGPSHSVVTSFAVGSLNVSRIFILSPPAFGASPSRGGLLSLRWAAIGLRPRCPADGHTFSLWARAKWARAHAFGVAEVERRDGLTSDCSWQRPVGRDHGCPLRCSHLFRTALAR